MFSFMLKFLPFLYQGALLTLMFLAGINRIQLAAEVDLLCCINTLLELSVSECIGLSVVWSCTLEHLAF